MEQTNQISQEGIIVKLNGPFIVLVYKFPSNIFKLTWMVQTETSYLEGLSI